MDEEKWEVVFTASGITNAHIVEGRLKTEGIPTKLQYEIAGTIYAITIDGLGAVNILIPAIYREKAEKVLSQSYEDEDLDWNRVEKAKD